MKFSKLLLAAVFAFVMTAGALMAADEPLEIHGGGRIGFTVNGKGGSNNGLSGTDNRMGRYPNHSETNYYSLWFSKKTTAESGAWSKVTFGIDKWNGNPSGDLANVSWRLRGFNVEFGALDFLPQGSTIKAGLFGLSQGWNDAQDFGPGPNFSGIGIGLANLGGIAGIYYMAQDANQNDGSAKLDGSYCTSNWQNLKGIGERTMHAFVINGTTPMVDFIAGVGFAKKADNGVELTAKEIDTEGNVYIAPKAKTSTKEETLVAFAAGAIVKLPVGVNVFGQFATNNWAMQLEDANADDTVLKNTSFEEGADGVGQKKAYKALCVKTGAYGVMDLASDMYVAPAMFYQYYKLGKEAIGNDGSGEDRVTHKIRGTVKFSKALTQNIAFAPALGYARTWTDASGDKAKQSIQATAGVDMGLNTGYWAGQRISVYASYVKVDKDHKLTGAYDGKTSAFFAGTYVTFGF